MSQLTPPKRFKRTSSAGAAASIRKRTWNTGGRRTLVRTWRNPSGSSGAWYGSPFGRSLRTEMTFAENREIPVTAGVPYTYLYSINSLYDPNVTGTGNQPRFFDTICGANNTSAPYQQYRVYASKIEVTFIPTGADSVTMRGLVGIGLFQHDGHWPGVTVRDACLLGLQEQVLVTGQAAPTPARSSVLATTPSSSMSRTSSTIRIILAPTARTRPPQAAGASLTCPMTRSRTARFRCSSRSPTIASFSIATTLLTLKPQENGRS